MSGPTERELQEYAERLARFRSIAAPASLRRDVRGAILAAPYVPGPARGTAWAMRLRPVLAVLVVFAILAGGAGSAAAGSLPGDAAFGLKRAVEDVQLTLASSDTARLDLLVAQSDRRLDELELLTSRGSSAAGRGADEYSSALARVEAMLAALSNEPQTAQRDAAIERAQTAVASHVTRLEALAAKLPEAAQAGIQRAIDAGKGVGADRTARPSRSPEPGKPSDLPGGAPASPGRPGESSRPTPPSPPHR